MGLFSKKREVVSARDFKFTRRELDKKLRNFQEDVYADRETETHRIFLELIETIRSMELLNLGHPRDGSMETYHYNQGRIDALSNFLQVRDTMIADERKNREANRKKTKPKNVKASSYLGGQAALSI